MDHIVETTEKLLRDCKPSEIEIEARIRQQLVSQHAVRRLIEGLTDWEVYTYSEKKKISKTNRKCTYRSRDGATICKSSIAKADVNDMWCAVHVSVEVDTPSMQRTLDGVPAVEVTRYRTVVDEHYVDVAMSDGDLRVEVEACAADRLDADIMMQVVRQVCALMQGSAEFTGYYDWRAVTHVAATNFGPFCIDKKQYQKPKTMTVDVLFSMARDLDSWAVTPKVDGERRFIVAFNGRAYSVDIARGVAVVGESSANKATVLDCEMANGKYYAFDVPVVEGQYCGSMDMDERTSLMDDVISGLSLQVVVKPYERFNSFDRLQRLHDVFVGRYDMDGLIFVNTRADYMQPVPKWKTHSTVDLEVMPTTLQLFTCDGHEMNVEHAELPDDAFGVWEFSFEHGKLVAKRSRPDKPQANSRFIVKKNILDSVPGTLFTGKGFYLMRKYHNRIKRQLVTDAHDAGATFLDIGTGQGGDVHKWSRAKWVFCVEPNHDSMREMRDRCDDDMWNKITPIFTRLAEVDPKDINAKVDIFTAFFCMNQFEDDDWGMLESLVTSKGSKRCRLLAIAITDPREHKSANLELIIQGTDRYNIKMHDTRIMDIDEKVVFPAHLDKIMKRCRMRLVKRERLDKNDFMTTDERRLSSMYSAFVYART